jgi:hypothetical protein
MLAVFHRRGLDPPSLYHKGKRTERRRDCRDGWMKRGLAYELVRILFYGRLCLLRLGILSGCLDIDGRRGVASAKAPEIFGKDF